MGQERRQAAERLLSLQRPNESNTDFARRLRITPQHITNYQTSGLSLEILARVAKKLSAADVLFVLTGERGSDEEVLARKADAYDQLADAFGRIHAGVEGTKGAPPKKKDAPERLPVRSVKKGRKV